jgi:hypothetical protein
MTRSKDSTASSWRNSRPRGVRSTSDGSKDLSWPGRPQVQPHLRRRPGGIRCIERHVHEVGALHLVERHGRRDKQGIARPARPDVAPSPGVHPRPRWPPVRTPPSLRGEPLTRSHRLPRAAQLPGFASIGVRLREDRRFVRGSVEPARLGMAPGSCPTVRRGGSRRRRSPPMALVCLWVAAGHTEG